MRFEEYTAEWKAGQRDPGPASVVHLDSLLGSRRMNTFDHKVVEDFIQTMERNGVGLATQGVAPAGEEERADLPQPHDPDPCPRQAGGVIQALDQADVDQVLATATTPDLRLIIALAAVHAARPKTIRTMLLEDVDLGNRRITVGGHVRPLDDLTRRAVLDWLGHRRSRWPTTASPHLLIPRRPSSNSARQASSGPPGPPATSPPPSNGSASTAGSKRPSPMAPTHSTSPSPSASTRRPPSATRTRLAHFWERPPSRHHRDEMRSPWFTL
ncbi:hypothetical protein ACR6C2_42790 [Streptomyces sp. INA 01156]